MPYVLAEGTRGAVAGEGGEMIRLSIYQTEDGFEVTVYDGAATIDRFTADKIELHIGKDE